MEVSEENLTSLAGYLSKTLDSSPAVRKPAEQFLESVESNQNYPLLLLHLMNNQNFDATVRISASVVFKNYIKRNWKVDEENGINKIHDADREAVKGYITTLMFNCTVESIQKQLSDVVSIIGKYDFPDKWPGLLDELIKQAAQGVNTGDYTVVNGALRTAHSLFKKYRYEFKTQKLWTEIRLVLDTFAKPLTELFVSTIKKIETESNPQTIGTAYTSLLFVAKIFYSLNFQDLPEFFEDNMSIWMTNFHALLTTDVPALRTDSSDDEAGLMEQLRCQICDNVVMYAQKYDEEFAPFVPGFVTDVWNLLTSIGNQQKFDLLVSNALSFLSTVADRTQYQSLFEEPTVLSSICEKVIIPNIEFRTCDEELFEDNPEEYIRRDIEGSDVDTRRRAACDLVKVLAKFFEEKIVGIFGAYIQAMLERFSQSTENWRNKNAAIYLVTSLAARGQTQKFGVTQISNFVNLTEFATKHILTELQRENVNELPVIRADAIRYIMTFRSILPKDIVISSISLLVKSLTSESKVVHSYAAACLEKIMLIKDPNTQKPYVEPEQLLPYAGLMLDYSFVCLNRPGSEENEYVIKAVLQCLHTLDSKSLTLLATTLPKLIEKLGVVAKNPSNPNFNHGLFETIALTIRIVCNYQAGAVTAFETELFPVFQVILQNDVVEFLPYVFQLISMFLEIRQKGEPIPLPYMELYPFLLVPVLWERTGNVHPLVRLISAYIGKTEPTEIQTKLQVNTLLGIFQRLISTRANDHEGFNLLKTLIEHCPNEVLLPNMKAVYTLLFQRLTQFKTLKFMRGFTVFTCFYMINYGASSLITMVDSIQPQIFGMVIEKIILSENLVIIGQVDKKIVIVGLAKLICEAKELTEGCYTRYWPSVLKLIIKMVVESEEPTTKTEELTVSIDNTGGFDVAYSKLIHASKPEYDPLQGIGTANAYLAQSLSNLYNSGKATSLIGSNLTMEEQVVLSNVMKTISV